MIKIELKLKHKSYKNQSNVFASFPIMQVRLHFIMPLELNLLELHLLLFAQLYLVCVQIHS